MDDQEASDKDRRRKRKLVVVLTVLATPFAAALCGVCCCFAALPVIDRIEYSPSAPGEALTILVSSVIIGVVVGGGLAIYVGRRRWKSIEDHTE